MQRITLTNRRYGYRRVTAELRRQGFTVNHKKVLRLMRNDNLLAIRKRRYVLTTDSDQHRAVYPNWLTHCKSTDSISSGSPTSATCACAARSSTWRS